MSLTDHFDKNDYLKELTSQEPCENHQTPSLASTGKTDLSKNYKLRDW